MGMTGIILAGGGSSRFGSDKAFIEIKGLPLIKRQIKFLKKIFKKIIIITNNPKKYHFRGIRIFQDIIPEKGPLGGIYSGLMNSDTLYNFVVACDMPNLNLKLIRYMIRQKNNFDVVVPRIKKGFEPLFAVYSKNCIRPLYETLNSRNLRIRNFFKKIMVRVINEDEILKFGNPDILFMNINTKIDLLKIK
jgi:molybdopterin-guanine dinucleotide biosynthesis protein A